MSKDVTEIVEVDSELVYKDDRFNRLHEYACNPDNFWPQIRERIKNLPDTFRQIKNSGGLVWLEDVKFISDIPGKNNGSKGMIGGGALALVI